MAVYAYYRVSTQTQAEKNSTEMQKYVVEGYCREHGIEIDGCFSDEGISGAMDYADDKLMRDGIISLLAQLEKGDRIIVQNTSRLWRSDMAKAMILHEVAKAGANVISVEQPTYDVYCKDPNDILINGIMELLDWHEKVCIAMKLYKGRTARANKGYKPCGAAPYGYKWDGNEIVIDYNNHLVVKEIFQKYIELRSLGKVKAYCDQCGYKTSTGKDFSTTALKNIIENDFYIGIVTFSGEKREGKHPVFLERELFDEANAVLKRKAA